MTHKFTPGEYKTRDGRKAVVLCDDAPGDTPLKGYIVIDDGGDSFARGWTVSGGTWSFENFKSSMDLMPPVTEPEQVVRWAYLWDVDGRAEPRMAMTATNPVEPWGIGLSGHKCIARTRVVLTPGVFEDEATPDPYTRGWNEAIDSAIAALTRAWATSYAATKIQLHNSVVGDIRVLKRSAP